MKISLNWVGDFVDLPPGLSAAELAHELTLKTVDVEDWIDVGAALEHVVVGRVAALKPVGDRGQTIVTCAVGAGQQGSPPHRTAVTRAANLEVGMLVAVAGTGARLRTAGETSAEVVPAEIAGVRTDAVICTAANLGLQRLFPARRGTDAVDLSEVGAAPGRGLADALGFDDVVLEIDNKSLTNRPDLWGHYGIARELATIYGRELKPLAAAPRPPLVDGLVGELDTEVCRRLAVVEFALDSVPAAPLWMRSRLARIGESTVNLCVDLSNYVMFTVGQPTHVYDADRITLPLSVARNTAVSKLELLTGERRELQPGTPVIRDATEPVAVAGVMGGLSSAVSAESRRFALEVATFRPAVVRRASQQLSLRTEASARFEKGLDTQRVDAAVDLFLTVLGEIAPGVAVTGMQEREPDPTPAAQLDVDLNFLSTRIGQPIAIEEVGRTLSSLGFTVVPDADLLHLTAPTWRSTGDVSMPHDIVEEVARIHGYDNIPVAPLSVALVPVRRLNRRPLDRLLREQLATRADMQEVVTYPWASDPMLRAAGLAKADTVRFEGAPAPDRDSLRPSLVPNLLEAVVANLRYRPSFRLFEVGTVFAALPLVPYHERFEPMPRQSSMIAGVLVGADGPALFRQGKGVLQMLSRYCHLTDLRFAAAGEDRAGGDRGDADGADLRGAAWADRSARLGIYAGGAMAGALGLLTNRCRKLAGIGDVQVACFELDLAALSAHRSRENRFEPISELPEADFDLSVVVADSVRWSDIESVVTDAHKLVHRVAFVDEFRGSWVPDGHKSVTLRLTLRPRNVTLTAEDIATARADAIAMLERTLNGRLRD